MPIAARYAHTNVVARDWEKLARFYVDVFGCVLVPPLRDQRGAWLDRATGVAGARLRGAHLRLPGHGEEGRTLEIYTYDETLPQALPVANRAGWGHLAFAVDDVPAALEAVLAAGGATLGEVSTHDVEGVGTLTVVYARDPEGNILELQAWSREAAR